jgi:hypothetical protein
MAIARQQLKAPAKAGVRVLVERTIACSPKGHQPNPGTTRTLLISVVQIDAPEQSSAPAL